MNVLREAFIGIITALATSLLVVGAIALAITEGMVVPEANLIPTTPTVELTDFGFPELRTATLRPSPTARLVAATTQPAPSTCPVIPGWERYVTQPGDSLSALGQARDLTIDQLMEANCLSSTTLIPGWQLYLPRLTATATAPPLPEALTGTVTVTPSTTTRPCGPPAGWVRYTVRSGDNMSRISKIFSVSIPDLQLSNCMGSSIFIRAGESIYVPNVTPIYTATPPPPPTSVPPTSVPPTTVPPSAVPPTAILTSTPVPAPALKLVKSANLAAITAINQNITYSYVLSNTGNVALSAPYAVSDDKTSVTCPSTPATLAPNATVTCAAQSTTRQADLDAGSLTNQASATARFGSQTVSSNKATLTIPATQKPELSLTHQASRSTYTAKNQVINYTITLQNSGNVTLTNPTVTADHGPGRCPGSLTTLAPAARLACSAAYPITQADLDAGSVTNQANPAMKFDTQTITANTMKATSSAVQTPALLLTKTGTLPASPFTAGKVIDYSDTLKNTGNVTLGRQITVSDNKVTVTCPATPATLAPGVSLTCSAVDTILAANITAGSVTHTATAHAGFNGAVDSNPATVTLSLAADPRPDPTAGSPLLQVAPDPRTHRDLLTPILNRL